MKAVIEYTLYILAIAPVIIFNLAMVYILYKLVINPEYVYQILSVIETWISIYGLFVIWFVWGYRYLNYKLETNY